MDFACGPRPVKANANGQRNCLLHTLKHSAVSFQTAKQFGNLATQSANPVSAPVLSNSPEALGGLGFPMQPEEVDAVLETICDLHDKVSDAIHALSRSHFMRSVQRRAAADGDKPAGFVHVKTGGGVTAVEGGGDEAAAVAEEARSLHAIRAALEDLEDQFECFIAVQSQQQAERDIALSRLQQSHIMLAIRLEGHHGKNSKVIDEASGFVQNVYHNVWPSISVKKPEKSMSHSGVDSTTKWKKGSNFLGQIVASSLDLATKSFSVETIGGLLGNSAVLAVGMITLLQLHWLASGEQSPSVGKYSYKSINQDNSPCLETSPLAAGSRMSHLDVFLAKS